MWRDRADDVYTIWMRSSSSALLASVLLPAASMLLMGDKRLEVELLTESIESDDDWRDDEFENGRLGSADATELRDELLRVNDAGGRAGEESTLKLTVLSLEMYERGIEGGCSRCTLGFCMPIDPIDALCW
jgi:hypothetical protein